MNTPPPPPLGGGATNPKPPGKHSPHSIGISKDTQSDGSPSLLSPSSLEDTAGFTVATVTHGQRTTPPHKAFVRTTVTLPTPTKNSFAALLSTASPTPSDNSDKHPTQMDGPPHPPPSQLNFPTMTPQADSKCHSDGFHAVFLDSWPEEMVTDATSRWI